MGKKMIINERMTEREKYLLRQVLDYARELRATLIKIGRGDPGSSVDYKDIDDAVFSELDFTQSELKQIYDKVGDMVYIASAVKDDYSDSSNKEKEWEMVKPEAAETQPSIKVLPKSKRYKPVNPNAIGPNGLPYEQDFMARWEENDKRLKEIDRQAKSEGVLLGRFIDEPFADGKAVYQIVAESGDKVEIVACTGIGDDWVIPYWGERTVIDRAYAQQKINGRDKLAEIFSKKSAPGPAAI